jgi:hypothetical protein
VRLVLQLAQETETPMPIGSLLRDRFLSALAKNRGDLDWSALALGTSDDAGLTASCSQKIGTVSCICSRRMPSKVRELIRDLEKAISGETTFSDSVRWH